MRFLLCDVWQLYGPFVAPNRMSVNADFAQNTLFEYLVMCCRAKSYALSSGSGFCVTQVGGDRAQLGPFRVDRTPGSARSPIAARRDWS